MSTSATFRIQVLSALRWTAGAKVLGQVISWATTVLVMRILNPGDYGLVAMATLFVSFLALFAEVGLGPAVVQTAKVEDDILRSVFGTVIVTDMALFAVLAGIAPLIAHFFAEPRLTAMIRVLSLQVPIGAVGVIPFAILTRDLKFKSQSLLELGAAAIGGLTSLGLALRGFGPWALIGASLVTAAWRAIGINFVSPYLSFPRFSLAGLRRLLIFGGNVTASRILWFFYSKADVFIAGKMLGKDKLGIYSVAFQLAALPVERISAIINQVAFPVFARIQDDADASRRYLLSAIHVLSIVAIPILWGLSCIAPEVAGVVLGPKWAQASFSLRVLGLVMPLLIVSPFMNTAAQGLGHAGLVLQNVITGSILMPIAFVIGARWGIEGLCLAWVLVFPLVFWINMKRVLPKLGITTSGFLGAMTKPAISGALMYALVTAFRSLAPGPKNTIFGLVTMICLGAVAYLTVILTIDQKGIRNFVGILQRG